MNEYPVDVVQVRAVIQVQMPIPPPDPSHPTPPPDPIAADRVQVSCTGSAIQQMNYFCDVATAPRVGDLMEVVIRPKLGGITRVNLAPPATERAAGTFGARIG